MAVTLVTVTSSIDFGLVHLSWGMALITTVKTLSITEYEQFLDEASLRISGPKKNDDPDY